MTGRPPLVVVVYGPPGSGKSTLAGALAARLRLTHFDKDEFKDLLLERLGVSDHTWSARVGSASWELLVLCTDRLLRSGVSLVIESNVRPDAPIVGQLGLIAETVPATVLGVYLSAHDTVLWERFDRRRSGGSHPGHVGYERRGEFVAALATAAHGPIDFGGPTFHLDTSTPRRRGPTRRRWPTGSPPVAMAARAPHTNSRDARGPWAGSANWRRP